MSRIDRFACWLFCGVLFALAGTALYPARSYAQSPTNDAAALPDEANDRSTRMTARIDELLAAAWVRDAIEPAASAEDTEFLRRASLDLTGVLPTVATVREFLADNSDDRRARLIDRLLASPLCADHLATTWRNMMVPRNAAADGFDGQEGLQAWLRTQFAANQRYDQLVADLLVATGAARSGPGLFFTAFDLKPEELAGNTARVFLGIQIECAQCHDHPFDRWTQQDFWGYAAFFARLGRGGDQQNMQLMQLVDRPTGEVTLPGSTEPVPPRYPRGDVPAADETGTRRMQLGIWMVSRDNPFLARAAVNRAWAHLFGRGLVEPVDDLSDRNPASHPELFAELAAYFVENGFDLRDLLRTLARTRAYQLSSRTGSGAPPRSESFARMPVKTLSPEQLYDSLQRATLAESATSGASRGALDPRRQMFVAKMQAQTQSPVEYDAGVAQVLLLLNGDEVASLAAGPASGLLTALEAPIFDDRQRVEILFLATLSRPPTERELQRSLSHVGEGASAGGEPREALGDLLWALVNSAEFGLNH